MRVTCSTKSAAQCIVVSAVIIVAIVALITVLSRETTAVATTKTTTPALPLITPTTTKGMIIKLIEIYVTKFEQVNRVL
jgi:hypothetical protein